MNYPIQIENEPQLSRLMHQMVKAIIKEVKPEKKQILMSMAECERTKGVSRNMIKSALANGNLKLHCIEGSVRIKTIDFENWQNKSQL